MIFLLYNIWRTHTHALTHKIDTIFNWIRFSSLFFSLSLDQLNFSLRMKSNRFKFQRKPQCDQWSSTIGFFNFQLFQREKKIKYRPPLGIVPIVRIFFSLFLSYLFRNVELCNAETNLNRNRFMHEYFEYFNWSSIEWLLLFYSFVSFFLLKSSSKAAIDKFCGLFPVLSHSNSIRLGFFSFVFFFGSFHLFNSVCCVLLSHSNFNLLVCVQCVHLYFMNCLNKFYLLTWRRNFIIILMLLWSHMIQLLLNISLLHTHTPLCA